MQLLLPTFWQGRKPAVRSSWHRKMILILLLGVTFQWASAQSVVISQVYGGGGNTGAPYTNDFIELFNASSSPVSINGWSLQYASGTGTGNFGANASQITELPNVTLQPGQYFLVQEASGTAGGALPTPDLVDATPINMSATAGKIALVQTTTTLGCNGGSSACSGTVTANIIDLIGYGSANYFEGSVAPAPSNTTALIRNASGCTDSNNNGADFATGAPVPRNTASSLNPCNGGGQTAPSAVAQAQPGTVSAGDSALLTVTVTPGTSPTSTGIAVTGDLSSIGGSTSQSFADNGTNGDVMAGDNIFSYQATVANTATAGAKTLSFTITDAQARSATTTTSLTVQPTLAAIPIYEIQGSGNSSPKVGQQVATIGVVSAVFQATGQFGGFYIQDAQGDGNPATSDGIFVFSTISVQIGSSVRIVGTVAETNGLTQLANVTAVTVLSTGNQLALTSIDLPVSTANELERYEGMLVSFVDTLTVTENYTLARFGELLLSVKPSYPFAQPDGRLYNPTNFVDPTDVPASGVENDENNTAAVTAQQLTNNLASILLDDASSVQNPTVVPYLGPDSTLRIGSTVSNLSGILTYGFSEYRVEPTTSPTFNYAPRPAVPSLGDANLKVASFNVLNYFTTLNTTNSSNGPRGANNPVEFERQQAKIVVAMKQMNADVLGLIEMENNGTVALNNLVQALNTSYGSEVYQAVVDPAGNGQLGTDAIKVAIIYKKALVTPFGSALADFNPVNNRPALAQTFSLNSTGERFTVVINHLKSKSGTGTGADADAGDGQGNFNFARVQQAQALVDFVNNTVLPAAGDSDVVLLGDFNAYSEEDPIDVLRNAGFATLLGPESYSYVFEGQSGSLDHALVSPSLAAQFTKAAKWHINSDEPLFLDYNLEFKGAGRTPDLYTPTPYRSSDHDPVLAGFRLSTPTVQFVKASDLLNEGVGTYQVELALSEASTQAGTVTFSLANGTGTIYGQDYTTGPEAVNNTFTLPVPAGSQSVTFTLNVVDDQLDELNETLTITLTNVSGGLKKGNHLTNTLTIEDNDVPVLSFTSSGASVQEGAGAFTIKVSSSIAPLSNQTFTIAINDYDLRYGAKQDYVTNPSGASGSFTLSLPAGDTTASFLVTPNKNSVKQKDSPQLIDFTIRQASAGLEIGTQNTFELAITNKKPLVYAVWPNPTTGYIQIVTNSKETPVEVTLRSCDGDVLFSGAGQVDVLSKALSSQLKANRSGIYHLQIVSQGKTTSIRILNL